MDRIHCVQVQGSYRKPVVFCLVKRHMRNYKEKLIECRVILFTILKKNVPVIFNMFPQAKGGNGR